MGTNLNNTSLKIQGAVIVVANPDDTAATEGTNTHTQDTTENRVGGRNRHTDLGSEGKVKRGSSDSTDHTQHEQGRGVLEVRDRDDLGTDGIGDTATDTDSTSKLKNGTENHSLDVGQRPRGHGRSPRVGGIVGTNVPSVEERKDGTNGQEVVELVERHLDGWG